VPKRPIAGNFQPWQAVANPAQLSRYYLKKDIEISKTGIARPNSYESEVDDQKLENR
jgi:hypothetical protein